MRAAGGSRTAVNRPGEPRKNKLKFPNKSHDDRVASERSADFSQKIIKKVIIMTHITDES